VNGAADGLMGADRIVALLTELGARLDRRGVEARIFIVGGAAMALAYDRRRITRDIDAVFEPKTIVYDEAAAMARDDRTLTDDWLNDGVKAFMPDRVKHPIAGTHFSTPGLSINVAPPEYVFAMKASAARSEADRDDLRTLVGILGITSVEAALAIVEQHYDPRRLTPKTQFFVEEVVAEAIADG
jgi:predicted nucleotidyltransferase